MSIRNVPLSIEPIAPFQVTFIGPPYPARLVKKTIKPKWTPFTKPRQYVAYQKNLPEFIQAVDSCLREALANIEIPPTFEKSKLYVLIMTEMTNYLESDIQLRSFIQTFEKTSPIHDPATYVKTLKRYSTEVDSIATSQISALAYMGLYSDITFDIFCDLALSFSTYQKLISYVTNVAETRIGKLYMKGFRTRTIEDKVKSYFHEIKPIMVEYADVVAKHFKLMLYADLSNSYKYEDVFKPKVLNIGSMNPEIFKNYHHEFKQKLQDLRRSLFSRAPSLFDTDVDYNDSGALLWLVSARKIFGGSANEG